MKTTKFVLSFLTLFAVAILFAGIASAGTLSIDADSIEFPDSVAHDAESFDITFDLTNTDGVETLDWTQSKVDVLSGTIEIDEEFNTIEANETLTVTATVTFDAFQQGTMEGTINVIGSENSPSFDFEVEIPEEKVLEIKDFDAPTANQAGSLTLENLGNVALKNIVFSASGNIEILFNPDKIANLAKNTASNPISLTIANLADLKFGLNPTTITARADDGTEVTTEQFTIKKTFCEEGTIGDLEIKTFDVENIDGGSDDEWEIFEEIEVEVEIENTANFDIDDVELELAFFDEDGEDFVDDLDWISSEEENPDLGNFNDGDEETHRFRFRVPADFAELGDSDYMLAVKAYSTDEGEDVQCVDTSDKLSDDFFEKIRIELPSEEDEEVVVTDIEFNQDPAVCGEIVSGQFSVYNLGDEEQDRILVHMRNSELDLDEEFEITRSLDAGKGTDVQFSFQLPQDANDDFYDLRFTTEFYYDDGDYDENSAETFIGSFRTICEDSGSSQGSALITIEPLGSDPSPGDEISLRVTITNTGSEEATFAVSALGYASWSTLNSLSPNLLTLDSGERQDITVELVIDDDASGEQSITIQAISGNSVNEREAEINILSSGSGITGFSVAGLGGSGFVWVLVLINIILIILIIIVAVRISRS